MKQEQVIYTLGTSDRNMEEFVDILKANGIKRVVDVRRFPTSKFDHFKKENMEKALDQAGLSYDLLGEELGGFRRGGYEGYIRTDAFRRAMNEVEGLAKKGCIVIVCAERLPWRCHRRFIGDELTRRGWSIIHIIEKNKTWEPKKQLDLLKS